MSVDAPSGHETSIMFWWIQPVLETASLRSTLRIADLPRLPSDLDPRHTSANFWRNWLPTSNKARAGSSQGGAAWRLLGVLLACCGPKYSALLALKLVNDVLNFAAPVLLGRLVATLSQAPEEGVGWQGLALAAVLAAVAVVKAFLGAHYTYQINRMACQMQSALVCAPFHQMLRVPVGTSDGHIQSLVAVDAARIAGLGVSSHELVSLPLQIVAALVLLYTQVQMAFVAGVAIAVALVPLNRRLAHMIGLATTRMMQRKDARLDVMLSLFNHFRSVFMLGWQDVFMEMAMRERQDEMRQLAVKKYLDAVCVCFWAVTSLLFATSTFGLMAWAQQPLTAEAVFTCMALFNILIAPLNAFPWVINSVVEAVVSARRFASYLSLGPQAPNDLGLRNGMCHIIAQRHAPPSEQIIEAIRAGTTSPRSQAMDIAVHFCDASFRWPCPEQPPDARPPALRRLSLAIPKRAKVVVTGPSGSGKSALLGAVLRELAPVSGFMFVKGATSFAPQTPWLLAATVRDNILVGSRMQPRRYVSVLAACQLQQDVATMPEGDLTLVTACGDSLSGGQRARIALARALYAASDIVLLDDVLAAVDRQVGAAIAAEAIFGPLLADQTVVLVSSDPLHLSRADFVVTMAGGEVASVAGGRTARPEDWERAVSSWASAGDRAGVDASARAAGNGPHRAPAFSEGQNSLAESSGDSEHGGLGASNGDGRSDAPPAGNDTASTAELDGDVGASEVREEGHVKSAVYRFYMQQAGWGWAVVVLATLVLMQLARTGNDLYLMHWVVPSEAAAHAPPFNATMVIMPPSRCAHLPASGAARLQSSLAAARSEVPLLGFSLNNCLWTSARGAPERRAALSLGEGASDMISMMMATSGGGPFLLGLLAITAAGVLFTVLRAFSYAYFGLRAARTIHLKLLSCVIASPLARLSRIPQGRLLARFSGDTATIDDSLPFTANILLANSAAFTAALSVMIYSQKLLALALVPLVGVYRRIQVHYRATARELRRLESITMGPIFGAYSEAHAGVPTIRALGCGSFFMAALERQVEDHMRVRVAGLAVQQWLALRLQLISASIVALLAFLGMATAAGLLPAWLAGGSHASLLTSLSLTYALPIVGLLNGLLTVSAETEQEMVAVERTLQYVGPPAAAGSGAQVFPVAARAVPPKPQGPMLIFEDVSMSYPGRLTPALSRVNIAVQAGQSLGVCGRTGAGAPLPHPLVAAALAAAAARRAGFESAKRADVSGVAVCGAGKSSLLNALFRLNRINSGRILLSGIDISLISDRDLRKLVAVVPQSPLLLSGTVAFNLDPWSLHPSHELLAVLADVGLLPALSRLARRTGGRAPSASVAAGAGDDDPDDVKAPLLASSAASDAIGALSKAPPDSPSDSSAGTDASHVVDMEHRGESAALPSCALVTADSLAALDLVLDPKLNALSAGQKQQLCLARALLNKPLMVCLDEVSASLGAEERQVVEQVLQARLKGFTLVHIAHSVDMLDACDLVVVLDRGQVVEVGHPLQLAQQPSSWFRRLRGSQVDV